ncbi:hypothetical protein GCM10009760_22590 [Kitasatospora kazusensis]|uniref:ABM domain-containing protein n=1 Tax=Kitasatospora kazusensis TaxID=407974 RepID=A0ABN2ZBZ2_9ACTN
MAVVLKMRWAGVTPEHYEAVREAVRWEEQPPEGLALHVASFDADAMYVTDVWNSPQDWETFFAERLRPAVEKAGLPGRPDSDLLPLHRRFVAPGVSGGA